MRPPVPVERGPAIVTASPGKTPSGIAVDETPLRGEPVHEPTPAQRAPDWTSQSSGQYTLPENSGLIAHAPVQHTQDLQTQSAVQYTQDARVTDSVGDVLSLRTGERLLGPCEPTPSDTPSAPPTPVTPFDPSRNASLFSEEGDKEGGGVGGGGSCL